MAQSVTQREQLIAGGEDGFSLQWRAWAVPAPGVPRFLCGVEEVADRSRDCQPCRLVRQLASAQRQRWIVNRIGSLGDRHVKPRSLAPDPESQPKPVV
jgi:hypothetical protein